MMLKGGTPHGHGCFVRAPLSSFRGRLRVVRAASSSSSSSSSYGDSDARRDLQKDAALWDSAIKEARSLLDEASQLAEQQTRAELEEAFDTDFVDEMSADSASTSRRGVEVSEMTEEEASEMLYSIWLKHGANEVQASRLVEESPKEGRYASPRRIERKLVRLSRILPACKLAVMALADMRILYQPSSAILATLIELMKWFDADTAMAMMQEEPRLATELRAGGGSGGDYDSGAPTLEAMVLETCEALRGIGGSAAASDAAVFFALSEEPSLIIKLPPLRDSSLSWRSRDIAEFPMDLQNSIAWAMRMKHAT
ncbi:hypothetical protein NFJ02_12g10850 [Pycnococcus provasolii]